MNNKNNEVDLQAYWAGVEKLLAAKIESIKEYISHSATGFAVEEYFRQLLREHLPQRYAVEAGFVMSASKERSPAIDIIIADVYRIPRLCKEPTYSIFSIESVCAVIEVTTSAEAHGKFEEDLRKLARVRLLGRKRHYLQAAITADGDQPKYHAQQLQISMPPAAFLITCGREWAQKETYQENLVAALKAVKQTFDVTWLHGALSINHGFLAFQSNTEFHCEPWNTTQRFVDFILFLNWIVARYSAHPWDCDMQKYYPPLPNKPTDDVKEG